MQPESKDDALMQYFDESDPPELLDVEIRKNRARIPNKRPPTADFLKRSKETAMDTEVEFRPIAERRLSFQKPDAALTRAPSIRRIESFITPKDGNTVPQWLQELRKRKKVNGDGAETTKTNTPTQKEVISDPPISKNEVKVEEAKSTPEEKPSVCVSDAKSDYSARARKISRSRPNKANEVKPTLTELQKGAERINNSIAELQRDMQILLEQIKQAQIDQ